MVSFLKINASKNQVKLLFDAIDYDKKKYISLTEFKNFIEETGYQSKKKSESKKLDQKTSMQDEIYFKIKETLVNQGLTLQRAIMNFDQKLSEVMTKASMEKLLVYIGVVLKNEEVDFLYNKVLESCGSNICSFEDFQNFAIKEQIEVISFDEKIHHIHPAVAVYVEKIMSMFRRLDINPAIAFKYLQHPTRDVVMRRTFLTCIQSFNLNMTQDDIVLVFEYFDEKGYGEIPLETFLEKFELLNSLSLTKLSGQEQEEDKSQHISKSKLSNRTQVVSILQKIYMYFVEKKYNKRQMQALFDHNGNGILSRDEFIDGVKALNLEIPLEKVRALANFLDK